MPPAPSKDRPGYPLAITPRTLIVTGKGGVGKSTVAAALALAYRDAGVRTLLVGIHGQSDAAARISSREIGYDPVPLSPGLHALSIDPDAALREYALLRLKVRAISDRLASNPIIDQFAQAAPGFRELLVLGKLWWLAEQKNARGRPRFETIIVDAPATGHGLSFLSMAGVVAKAFPVGPIAAEASAVDAFVRSPERVGAVLVALPEEIPINETIELHDELGSRGINIAATIVNAVVPQRFSDEEIATLSTVTQPQYAATVSVVLREAHRAAEQQAEIRRLADHEGSAPFLLPFVPKADLTPDDIAAAAEQMTSRRGQVATRSRQGARR